MLLPANVTDREIEPLLHTKELSCYRFPGGYVTLEDHKARQVQTYLVPNYTSQTPAAYLPICLLGSGEDQGANRVPYRAADITLLQGFNNPDAQDNLLLQPQSAIEDGNESCAIQEDEKTANSSHTPSGPSNE